MTKDNLDEMLELTLEMEGLLTLMLKRDDMTPPRVTAMLERKARRFNELLNIKTIEANAAGPAPAKCAVEAQSMVVEPVVASVQESIPQPEEPAEIEQQVEQEEIAEAAEMEQTEDAGPAEAAAAPVAEESPAAIEEPAELVLNDVLSKGKLSFTLNDKFRFKRTIFDNSEEEFEGTIRVINDMTSMDEVSDYLYNDLCLDPNNEDVKYFVEVVSAHFN